MKNANTSWSPTLSDIHLTEKEKQGETYLMDNIDFWIASLVREKKDIKTYRDYYAGVRNEKEFAYLTENLGLGTPSKLKFTNLIKPRIDALLGQVVRESFTYRVSCMDDKTISLAEEERKAAHLQAVKYSLDQFVQINMQAQQGEGDQEGTVTGLSGDIKKHADKFSTNYLSDFEIAAQDVLKYFEQAVHVDLKQKLKQLALDLLLTGQCFYRVYVETVGDDPILEIVKAENVFLNKNTSSQYATDSTDAVVRREFWTRKEIIRRYARYMSSQQKEELFGDTTRLASGRSVRTGIDIDSRVGEDEPYAGQKSFSMQDTLEVFHVEWLALNEIPMTEEDKADIITADGVNSKLQKKQYRVDRYEGTRIGGTVYVNCGKCDVPRSQTRPLDATFSYGGVMYNDRGGKPYSIVGAMKDIQDLYDVTMFYRDNLVANSGVPGSRINVAAIPKKLGVDFMDRLQKSMAMKRNGYELIDPTEKGAHLFQNYGDFDNSVSGSTLQGFDSMLVAIERQADAIAGVNKQLLGQIAERDAVTNVKQGIMQTLLINEDLFEVIRSNQKRLLSSMLQSAQVAYRKGKKGSYIAGSEAYVFQVNPDKFCFSDFGINITYSTADEIKLQSLRELGKEFVGSGILDPDVLTHIVLSDSATEVKHIMNKAWIKKKSENDELGQVSQAKEQLEQQVQQMENELKKLQSQLQSNENANQQIRAQEAEAKRQEADKKLALEQEKIKDEKSFKDQELGLKKEVVQLEREQLYMATDQSKEVKNF